MARSVGDLYPALLAISGEDGTDPSAAPAVLGDPAVVDISELRVVWFVENGIAEPTDEGTTSVWDAAGTLSPHGGGAHRGRAGRLAFARHHQVSAIEWI
jgi:Asp-tRNA(Asn)/Glu-tRNA(Gln) amidotransferase A subunit family amidase